MTINTNNEFVTRQEFDAFVKASVASMNIKEINKGFIYQVGERLSKQGADLRQKQDARARECRSFLYKLYMILECLISLVVHSLVALGSALKDSWKTASLLQVKNSGIRSIFYFVIIWFSAYLSIGLIVGSCAYLKYYIITFDLLQLDTNPDILRDKLPIILLSCAILMLMVSIIIYHSLIRTLSMMHPKWLLLEYWSPLMPNVILVNAIMMTSLIWLDFVEISPKIKEMPHIKEYLPVMHTPFLPLMAGILAMIVIFSNYRVSNEYIKKHPILMYDINKPKI